MIPISDIRRKEMIRALADDIAGDKLLGVTLDNILALVPPPPVMPEQCPSAVLMAVMGHSKATATQAQLMWEAIRKYGYGTPDELDRLILQGAKRWAIKWTDSQLTQTDEPTREFVENIRKAIARDTVTRFVPPTWQVWGLDAMGSPELLRTDTDERDARDYAARTKTAWVVPVPGRQMEAK